MRKAPFVLTLCAIALANAMAVPARVSAQTAEFSPRFEVGAVVNEFVALGIPSFNPLIGPRVSVWLMPKVSVQLDMRLFARSGTQGLYGMRVRFMPRADASSWYLFGGSAGSFQFPARLSYPGRDTMPAGGYDRPGGIRRPMFLNGGAGRRFVTRGGWSASVEGEVWTSWDGGIATGATFDLSYSLRRSKN
jgi:hypothetical protein